MPAVKRANKRFCSLKIFLNLSNKNALSICQNNFAVKPTRFETLIIFHNLVNMFSKTVVFAAWVSACYAFAPMQSNSFRTKSRTNLDANTIISSTSTSLFATVANNTELLSPTFVPTPRQSSTTVAAVPKMAQRWRKSTKQLATLGPASSTKEMIEKLFLAGADVFRLNFSHGSQEQKKELLIIIRVSIC